MKWNIEEKLGGNPNENRNENWLWCQKYLQTAYDTVTLGLIYSLSVFNEWGNKCPHYRKNVSNLELYAHCLAHIEVQ